MHELEVQTHLSITEQQELKIQKLKEQLDSEQKTRALIEASKINLERELEENKDQTETLHQQFKKQISSISSQVDTETKQLKATIQKLKEKKEDVKNDKDTFARETESLKSRLEKEKLANDELEKERDQAFSQIKSLQEQIEQLESSKKSIGPDKLVEAEKRCADLSQQLAQQQDAYQKLEKKHTKLLRGVAAMSTEN